MKFIDEIDLDDKVINELLKECRIQAKKEDFKSCNNCRLKFKCWTHRKDES